MVEVINANIGLVAALVLSGATFGLLVARLVLPGPKRVHALEEELEQVRKEHQDYRVGVTTHFKKTAELVGEMTQSYKAVYDHLADGAQNLCGEYDALTSSVFGPLRIIRDPKVAVGDRVAGETETVASQPTTATDAELPERQFSIDDHAEGVHRTAGDAQVDVQTEAQVEAIDEPMKDPTQAPTSDVSASGDRTQSGNGSVA